MTSNLKSVNATNSTRQTGRGAFFVAKHRQGRGTMQANFKACVRSLIMCDYAHAHFYVSYRNASS